MARMRGAYHGSCFSEKGGDVRINVITEFLDPGGQCVPVKWSMAGLAVNSATGVSDNAPFGSDTSSSTWMPVSCDNEPRLSD